MRQSHGQEIAASAYPNPSIFGSAGHGSIRDPSTGVSIIERTITFQQPLEWIGIRQARREAAEAGVAGATAALEDARLALVAETKAAFYFLLFAQRDQALAAQNLTSVQEVLRLVEKRVAAGEATSFEAMKAGVEKQKAQKDLSRARHALLVAQTRLDTLTAGALGKEFTLQGDFLSPSGSLELERLTARAMDVHPTILRLAKLAEQADHSLRFERAARIPNISLLGSYHREAGDESVIAGLSVPLPLWYQRQGEIETALGTKYRAEAEREHAQRELEQAIVQHTQEVRTAEDQLRVFESGLLEQAEKTLSVARVSFREGAASLLDVLDAQRVHRQTMLEYAQARTDLSIALVRLERVVGFPL